MSWPFNVDSILAVIAGFGLLFGLLAGWAQAREDEIKRKQAEFKHSQEYRDYLEQWKQIRGE